MERVTEGMLVYSVDGEKLGRITRCEEDGFEIEKGFFFPREYFARYADVSRIDGDTAYLRHGKAALEAGTQGAEPAIGAPAASTVEARRSDEIRVPIAEERLEVDKRVRETGEVRVHKQVRTEVEQVDVPVTREEVTVERVAVDTARDAGTEATFEEETVRVPVHEEEVEIRKRPVVREEVRISKEAVQQRRPVSETVRREEVEIDDTASRPGSSGEIGAQAGGPIDPMKR